MPVRHAAGRADSSQASNRGASLRARASGIWPSAAASRSSASARSRAAARRMARVSNGRRMPSSVVEGMVWHAPGMAAGGRCGVADFGGSGRRYVLGAHAKFIAYPIRNGKPLSVDCFDWGFTFMARMRAVLPTRAATASGSRRSPGCRRGRRNHFPVARVVFAHPRQNRRQPKHSVSLRRDTAGATLASVPGGPISA